MAYCMPTDARSRKAGRFIHRVHGELQRAFDESGLTEQQIADRLGVDTEHVTRSLNGEAPLSLRAIADLAWAMDAKIEFTLSR